MNQQQILDALRQQNLIIQSVRVVRQSLEDLFIQTVAGTVTAQAVAPPLAKGSRS